MHKNNRFSNTNSVGKITRKADYEFATGFPQSVGKNNTKPKVDQGTLQPDQNLKYLQAPNDSE